MRVPIIRPVLLSLLLAAPLAAQERVAVSGIQPLPEILAPRQAPAEAPAMKAIEAGAVTGMVLGAVIGGVYGAFFAEECGVEGERGGEEGDCMLSREVKAVGFVAIGAGVGGAIGLGTSFLLGWRAAKPEAAPLRIAAAAAGGMSVGVSLRH